MRVVSRPVGEAHGGEKFEALLVKGLEDGLLDQLLIRPLLRQQLARQRDVPQRRVLREEVEALENQAEVQPLALKKSEIIASSGNLIYDATGRGLAGYNPVVIRDDGGGT